MTTCMDNPPEGGMGYHHQNDALLDDRIELERPEMLVYERLPDGVYRLNGVEYIVPFSVRPTDAEPPTVMGQELKPAPSLGIWYRHVWVWLENPSGLFADWNPRVECAPSDPVSGIRGRRHVSNRRAVATLSEKRIRTSFPISPMLLTALITNEEGSFGQREREEGGWREGWSDAGKNVLN